MKQRFGTDYPAHAFASRGLRSAGALTALAVSLAAAACGGAAVPNDQMASSQAAIRAAQVGGAEQDPETALLVKKAEEQIAEAKKLIEDGDNHRAEMVLLRAQSDADLALARAQELTMRNEAAQARKQVEELKNRRRPSP